ncbi:hypothetical protein CDL12_01621 [Handroanthus impetiginosus]|uniref:DUF4216 domain-containing protein n=1 Tax=Handroanthus impetiginosus TaxID=429701 RepID=A0A2G9I796_9LAMI|nr:hypothetical protein CDL12_01621 [Handroanthus impetiginosus]
MEVVELEYCGYPIKKVILFLCNWFNPTPVYYVPYPKKIRDKINSWVVIKTKARGRVEIDEMQEVSYQNDIFTTIDTIMSDELCENPLDYSHLIENMNESNLLCNDRAISDDVDDEVKLNEDKDEDEDEIEDKATSEFGNSVEF